MEYSRKQLEFMAEEMDLPISKVIMITENPPTIAGAKPCRDCKEKEKDK